MNNKIFKKIFIIINVIFFTILLSKTVKAANLSIKTSKTTVEPGESFTVTVSLNGGAGPISANSSNATGSKSDWLDNSSYSFSCKAGNSGNVIISASGTVGDYVTEEDVSVSASKTVKIVEKNTTVPEVTKNKNTTNKTIKNQNTNKTKKNNIKNSNTEKQVITNENEKKTDKEDTRYLLKKLQIEGFDIIPTFNSEIFEYELKVTGKNIEKLIINAETNKNDTIVNIKGNENLNIGQNIITIELKGQEDKQITVYTIKVNKEKSDLDIANEKITELINQNMFLFYLLISSIIINILLIIVLIINRINNKKKNV